MGYWRKANCIHKWFVDNVQDGNDDCGDYYVSEEQLKELAELCQKDIDYLNSLVYINSDEQEDFFSKEKFTYKIYTNVDETKINLPPQSGFFFGNTEYNEYYLETLQETINIITPLLEDGNGDIYYSSSW